MSLADQSMPADVHADRAVIDIHTHIYPEVYLDHLSQRTELPYVQATEESRTLFIFPGEAGRVMDRTYWSVDAKLEYMAASGITQSVVSLGNPWLEPFGTEEGEALASTVNEYLAGLEASTGGRIVGMGCLADGSIEVAARMIHEIADASGLYGVVSGTRICHRQLDDPELEPIWRALADTGQPLLVHPHHGLGLPEMDDYGHMLPLALGFPFETTVALARLAASGVFDRYPSLRVIGSHGGGAIPYLAARLDGCWEPDEVARSRCARPPSTALGNLYLDALVYHPRALHAAADLVGTGRMMFGTDHPFAIFNPQGSQIIRGAFDAEQSAEVLSGTARQLFGLPTPSPSTPQPVVHT